MGKLAKPVCLLALQHPALLGGSSQQCGPQLGIGRALLRELTALLQKSSQRNTGLPGGRCSSGCPSLDPAWRGELACAHVPLSPLLLPPSPAPGATSPIFHLPCNHVHGQAAQCLTWQSLAEAFSSFRQTRKAPNRGSQRSKTWQEPRPGKGRLAVACSWHHAGICRHPAPPWHRQGCAEGAWGGHECIIGWL